MDQDKEPMGPGAIPKSRVRETTLMTDDAIRTCAFEQEIEELDPNDSISMYGYQPSSVSRINVSSSNSKASLQLAKERE